ncbi:hypothetical protein M758_UG299400 [Ceratodon purpureus]|nr:hypothetical protein M758_UG299400 [Ceratodon purpureus]
MAKVSIPVVGIAFLCDILAFGLACGAVARRSRAAPYYAEPGYLTCGYTSDASTGLAATAFVFLLFGQVLITAVTSCFCCGKTHSTPGLGRVCSILLLVISWVSFAIAEIFLLTGVVVNNIKTQGQVDIGVTTQDEVNCAQAKKFIFAVGAAFTFLTMAFSLVYYFMQAGAESKDQQWNSYRGEADGYHRQSDPYTAHDGPHVGMTAYN